MVVWIMSPLIFIHHWNLLPNLWWRWIVSPVQMEMHILKLVLMQDPAHTNMELWTLMVLVWFLSTLLSQPHLYLFGRTQKLKGCRSEEHTSELQSRENLVCRLLLEKKSNL